MKAERMIVLLTKDLFFIPISKAAAELNGTESKVISSTQDPRLADLDPNCIQVWLLDLSAIAVADLPASVQRCRQLAPKAKVAAFGPHVQTARLEAAQAAEADFVLTRGQLDRQLPQLLAEWIAASPSPNGSDVA